jgi:hypothetical protein
MYFSTFVFANESITIKDKEQTSDKCLLQFYLWEKLLDKSEIYK